jgi:hypothetical protein
MSNVRELAKYAAHHAKQAGWKSEMLGYGAGKGLGAFGGAALGNILQQLHGQDALLDARTGANLGANLPDAVGSLAALATPTRNVDEQGEADQKHLRNFIPGVASYNAWKRFGHSVRGPEIREGQRKAKEKKKEKNDEEKKAAFIRQLVKSAASRQIPT